MGRGLVLRGTESVLDAVYDAGEAFFGDAVVSFAAAALNAEQSPVLHPAEVFGCHVMRDLAGFGKFSDGELAVEQYLDDADTVRMGKRFKAFGGVLKCLKVQRAMFDRVHVVIIYRIITICQYKKHLARFSPKTTLLLD